MDSFAQHLRYALRTLAKSPGFTLTAVLSLALGIGANTAIFSLVNAVLLRPLPYPDAGRLVSVGHTAPGLNMARAGQSDGTFLHYQKQNRVFEKFALYNENVVNLHAASGPERVPVALVTRDLFPILGASPALGRLFDDEDERAGAPQAVVLSHGLWTRGLGSDPTIFGRMIELNSVPRLVVGIAPPDFAFPRRETEIWYVWSPNRATARFSALVYSGLARLKPGVTPGEAAADLNRLIPSLADAYPDASPQLLKNAQLHAVVTPLKDAIIGDVGTALWVLLGTVGFVLLIACSNVANLQLVRAEHRQKEVAVRTALGATRADLVRYVLAESALLAGLGGVGGVALASVGVRLIVSLGPENVPRLHEVRIDGASLVVTAGVSILAALLFGAVPISRYVRPTLTEMLKDSAGSVTTGPKRQRAREVLVAAQVAMALTLMSGAGLLIQSFWRLKNVDPGFDPHGVLTMDFALPFKAYPDYASAARFWDAVLQRIRVQPGVEAAGAVSDLPLRDSVGKGYLQRSLAIEEHPPAPQQALPVVNVKMFTPGYFEAMRIPVLQVRTFRPGDRADTTRPVLVNAALARRFFPQSNAIGKRVRQAKGTGESSQSWTTIAGVVGNVRDWSLSAEPAPSLYVPILDRPVDEGLPPNYMSLAIRTGLPPASLTPAVRRIVRELDPELPIANVQTMDRIVADSTARLNFTMFVLLIAAVVALFLGAVGIYGVVSYTVTQRTREIGVRVALGARPLDLRRLVLLQATVVTLTGLGFGLLAAFGLSRFLGTLLFEVKPNDPATLLAAVTLLVVIAVGASFLPARRATKVDPMIALRYE